MEERILIVVPAYNEENNIQEVIRGIKVHVPQADILVVNDASFDDTSARARAIQGVRVVDLPYNLGIGGAVQTGFKYARDHGYRFMVQIDGDGQHLPQEVGKLVRQMQETGCDMVIGSRFLEVHSFQPSLPRRIGIGIFQLLFKCLIHLRITDSTSGFRLYNRKCIEILARFYANDYPEPDAIVLLKKQGLQICEVGVEMRERITGASSITPIKSPYYMVKVILAILCSSTRTRG